MGRTSYMIFPSHGSTSWRLTGETNSSSTTLHMDTCSWKLTGEANSTTPHVDILWLTGKVMKHTLLDTRPQKLIGVVMTLMDLITLHPCPSSILMTYWGESSSYLWMRMGRERGLPFLSMSRIPVNNKSQEKIDGDQLDDLISYNQLMEYLEDKTDTGPLEDGLYRFKCIKDHKGPYTSSDPEYNGSSYNLLIEWEPGEQTWEPLSNIIASHPYTCAVYAKEHNLLNTPGWKLLKKQARTARRLIRTLKKSKFRQARASRKYKHGWEVPRDYAHAQQLDIHNGNNKWKEAIDLEIEQIKEYQVFTDVGNAYLQAHTREKL